MILIKGLPFQDGRETSLHVEMPHRDSKLAENGRVAIAPLESMNENSVVPPGLGSFVALFPALKRWANIDRPFGTSMARD
jgi:hypothetical protein